LKLEAALIDPELLRVGLRVRDAADVVRPECRGRDRLVLEQNAGADFEVRVALRFLQPDRDTPAVLRRLDLLVIPVSALHESHGETRASLPAPFDQVREVAFRIAQVGLDHDAGVRPVAELRLVEQRPEKFQRRVFVRVALHVEIDEGSDFARAAQDRAQLRREVRDCVLRVCRVHLRIKRGDFYRHVDDREQLGVFAQRIGPAAGPFRQAVEQMEAALGVFVRLLFAHHRFAEEIDREPDLFLAPLAQHFHHVVGVAPGDELARHAGDVPAENRRG
jgi:hypothetical protein